MTPPTGLPSPSGAQVRWVRRLTTRKGRVSTGAFLAEGPQAVREALRAGVVTHVFADRPTTLVEEAGSRGVDVYGVDEATLASMCDTVTPQGIVAACRRADARLEDLPALPRLVVICAQIRDPGNAGTVVRCADAFGADAVIFTEASVEAHNPKTVRASVGSIFHLPVIEGVSLDAAVSEVRARGLRVRAADAGGARRLDTFSAAELAAPTAWVMGNEAWGLPAEHAALADERVAVPIWGAAESLNLSTAAAVLLYASAAAQRASG